jgi:hypothetical protein
MSKAKLVFTADCVAAASLRPAGDVRGYYVAASFLAGAKRMLLYQQRPRPHQTHVTTQKRFTAQEVRQW